MKGACRLKIKKLAAITLAMALILGTGTALALDPIKIIVDGKEVAGDTPAQIVNGRTMVPIRLVAESMDAEVSWDSVNRQVIINKAEPAETWNIMKVNGEPTTWPYWIIDGDFYMEYRNCMDLLETVYKAPWHQIDYNSITKSLIIDRKAVGVYTKQAGDFTLVPLKDLQRHEVITYEWQAEEENLVFAAYK